MGSGVESQRTRRTLPLRFRCADDRVTQTILGHGSQRLLGHALRGWKINAGKVKLPKSHHHLGREEPRPNRSNHVSQRVVVVFDDWLRQAGVR